MLFRSFPSPSIDIQPVRHKFVEHVVVASVLGSIPSDSWYEASALMFGNPLSCLGHFSFSMFFICSANKSSASAIAAGYQLLQALPSDLSPPSNRTARRRGSNANRIRRLRREAGKPVRKFSCLENVPGRHYPRPLKIISIRLYQGNPRQNPSHRIRSMW